MPPLTNLSQAVADFLLRHQRARHSIGPGRKTVDTYMARCNGIAYDRVYLTIPKNAAERAKRARWIARRARRMAEHRARKMAWKSAAIATRKRYREIGAAP